MKQRKGSVGVAILTVLGGIMLLILMGALASALNLITIPWLKFDRQVQMNRDIVEKTYDADNALYNYHWFKERHEAIKATEKKVIIAKKELSNFELLAGERTNWTFEDKTEDARLRSIYQGLRNHYEDIVAEYNARAKESDRSIFKDELPVFFTLNPF